MSDRAAPVVPTRQGSVVSTSHQPQHTSQLTSNNSYPPNPYLPLISKPVSRQESVAPDYNVGSQPAPYTGHDHSFDPVALGQFVRTPQEGVTPGNYVSPQQPGLQSQATYSPQFSHPNIQQPRSSVALARQGSVPITLFQHPSGQTQQLEYFLPTMGALGNSLFPSVQGGLPRQDSTMSDCSTSSQRTEPGDNPQNYNQSMGGSSFARYPPSSIDLSRQGSLESTSSFSSENIRGLENGGQFSQPIRSDSVNIPPSSSSLALRRQATMPLDSNNFSLYPQSILRGDTLILPDEPHGNRPDSRKENRSVVSVGMADLQTSLKAVKVTDPRRKSKGPEAILSPAPQPLKKSSSVVFKPSGLKSHTTSKGLVQYTSPPINGLFWLDERNSTAAIPDGCFQEMVPAPDFVAPMPRQIFYQQIRDIFSVKFEPHLYDVNRDVFGVPLRDCLNGIGMRDADDRIFKRWHDAGHTYIRLEITWPGYPHLRWGMDFSIYELGQQLITRREMAYKIACHYQNLCEIIDLNALELMENKDAPLLGEDPRWRIGQGGYSFDRMRLAGISRTSDNVWQANIWVLTDDDFPQDPNRFFMLESVHDL